MKPDFLGARGSNAGDDFHEWWALRSALRLLTPETLLSAVTVEGVNLDNREGQELTEWNAVDCGLYYGGRTLEQAEKVVIEQLKYSSSTPKKAWTVSELTLSKSKLINNSIIKKLADSFSATQSIRPDLIKTNAFTISLVSNRPMGTDLQRSLTNSSHQKHETLRIASGLNIKNFNKFVALFDFSNCGTGSRFEQEEKAINEILSLTQSTDRGFVLDLKDRIHKLMLPETTARYITSETVLTWMSVSDPLALFPCPSRLKTVENLVNRDAAIKIHSAMLKDAQYICLHGEGGSGKTTLLKQIEKLLPDSSTMITYDCYGAGTYMDSEAYRHRPKDAYLQIINETAARLRLPLLISQGSTIDFLKAFSLRIESASKIIKAEAEDALLVVVIDAADNTVTGAKQCLPEETSFVHELIKIGNLPSNVRLMISARTGRLDSLSIPDKYKSVEISNFSLEETALNVSRQYPSATEAWIEDFHNLSNQNPRVQSYAFEYAGSDPGNAIDFLRPNGKGLDQIFETRFEEAILKEGNSDVLSLVCSSLIALPTPVPKQHLASVVGLSKERINDIVSDLPGMRVLEGKVGFLDEDVEFFVRKKAEPKLLEAYQRSAAHFCAHHENDEYSAIHLAPALFSAGEGRKIIEIIQESEAPLAIRDQIIRREVQRQRLQLAMKVCRSAGEPADAIFTLLVGAEAIKTDDAVDKIIAENPDLSIHFASDTVGRNILYSSKTYESHGRFLSHIVARDAADKDFIAAREKKRILHEWMNRRSEDIERQKSEKSEHRHQHTEPWPIEIEDIAAIAHSVLDMEGYKAAYDFICTWKPRKIQYKIALILVDRLLSSGNADTLQEFLGSGSIPEPWLSIFSIPLALVGYDINYVALKKSLCNKKILKYCDLKELELQISEEEHSFSYAELILTGCEILGANGIDLFGVEPILENLCPEKWRIVESIYTHDTRKNDVCFRAYSLLRRHRGLDATIESYWIDTTFAEDIDETEKNSQKQKLSKRKRELKESLSHLITVYSVRADILLSNISLAELEEKAKNSLKSFFSNAWRISKEHNFEVLCSRLSLTLAKLSIVPNVDMNTVLFLAKESFKEWPSVFSLGQRRVISYLIKIPALRDSTVNDIYERSVEVKNLKMPASEKISILLDLSRILLLMDKDEAREVFKIAVDIANDVDVDVMYDVSLFSALSRNSQKHFSKKSSQQIANQMAAIITEFGTLLEGYEHFPWIDAISAIAILDMPKAISLIGYWEDTGLAPASETLPSLMSIGIAVGTISPAQVASLLNLCDELDVEFLAKAAKATCSKDARQLIEETARAELLRFNRCGSGKVCQTLNKLIPYNDSSGYWHSALNQLVLFKAQSTENAKTNTDGYQRDSSVRELKEKAFIEGVNIEAITFESPSGFIDSIQAKRKEARDEGLYIGNDDILKSVSSRLKSQERIIFLNHLTDKRVIDGIGYTWAKTLISCINLWVESSHTVSSWKEEKLPTLIAEHLGEFASMEGYGYDKVLLTDALDSLNLDQKSTVDLLLDGLERNADTLPLPKLYSVIVLLTDFCCEKQVADVTTRYLQRLTTQLKLPKSTIDSECSVESALACQLYSFLGDVDTRVRWRAAHSIRAAARMGDLQAIVELINLYDHKAMPGYRENNVPFYWLSARLWLVITFDRISSETPKAIAPIAHWLLEVAIDQDFPHVLIRQFAKSTLMRLLSGGFIDFDDQDVTAVHTINASVLEAKESQRRVSRGGFNQEGKERAFSFNALDTLSYVYPSAIECFADVDQETFLDEAEAWIIDRWKNASDLSIWENEPRKYEFERAHFSLTSHSHGAKPTVERHSYYLEWQAMWCSLGSLMKNKALADFKYDDDDDYGTLTGFLRQEGLTQPPHWSSDLRGPPPLEKRFHYPPIIEIEKWVTLVDTNAFDCEVGLTYDNDFLVVEASHDIRTSMHRSTSRISSSLVNPGTGLSLLRALQTSDDSHDYQLPPFDDNFEVDDEPYNLRGWIRKCNGDSRLDQMDTFNRGVRMIESMPSEDVIDVLGLCRSDTFPPSWINTDNGRKAFTYEAWGDARDDSRQAEYIHDGDVKSDGHRLKILPSSLKYYLNKVGFDLILEVEINRRVSDNGITKYDQKSEKEARYARLYLFRGTGEIFTAEGCAGTWTSSCN